MSAGSWNDGPLPSSERLLRTIIDSEPQCVKVLAADGTILDMNPAGLAMVGAESVEQVQGRSIYTLVADEHRRAYQALTEAAAAGQAGTLQFKAIGLNGGVLWLETRAVPLRDPLAPAAAVLGITRDITEQRNAEEALRESHRLLQAVIDGTPDAVFVKDAEGRFLLINRAGAALLGGRTPDEVIGRADVDLCPPGSLTHIREMDRRIMEADGPQTFEEEITGATMTRTFLSTKAPYRGPDGNVVGLVGIARDITERKRGEKALRLASSRLNALLEHQPSGVLLEDAARRIVYANPAVCTMLGFRSPEAVIGRDARDLARDIEPLFAEGEAFLQRTEQTAAQRRLAKGQRLSLLDGRHFERDSVPVTAQDEFLGMLWHYRDVTERERSLSLLNATLESTADGLLVTDTRGRIISFNEKFARMWRVPADVLATRDDEAALAFVLEQLRDPEGFLRKVREIYAQTEEESFDVIEFKDGRIFERYTMPQRIGGRSVGRVASFRDITERREIEERLRHSQKLEAVGRLAGGVAHDFNNILTALLGYSSRLLLTVETSDPLRPPVEGIQKATERAASLTQQLLAFSRRQVLRPRVLSLSAVVSGMDDMLRRVIPESIELVTALDPAVGPVRADPSQMEQVVLNLVLNARDAMPSGGRVTLATSNVDLHEPLAQERLSVPPGRYAALSVRDGGLGMSADVRAHIFEPFFTTKGPGQGTGLGLATVYGIVRQSAGYVWAESPPGQGTTMRVFLPQVEAEVDEVTAPPPPPQEGRVAATILLVEDDEAVRAIAREVLEMEGYRVLQARNGQEAIDLARTTAEPIHLLFTDVVMPGMNGHELAARLAEMRRGIRILYASGYDEQTLREDPPAVGEALLQKPYRPDDLVRRVRQALS